MKFYPDDYSFQNNLSFRPINRMHVDSIRERMSEPGDPELNIGNFYGYVIADMINEIEQFAPEFSTSLTRTEFINYDSCRGVAKNDDLPWNVINFCLVYSLVIKMLAEIERIREIELADAPLARAADA